MPTLDQQQAALVWLNEKFGVEHHFSRGEFLPMKLNIAVSGITAFLVDKEGREWRLSEVLAAYREESKNGR